MANKPISTAEVIRNRFTFAQGQQSALFDDFARYRQLWRSKIESPESYPWDYTLFNPMVFSTIRSFVARIASGNVGVDLQAWTEAERPRVRINKSLLEWEFQQVHLFEVVARWVYSAALYGKGFVETGWLFEKERYVQEHDGKGKDGRKILMRPKVNRADLQNRRVFDFFVANRNIPNFQAQPWLVVRQYRSVFDMERINEQRKAAGLEPAYRNLDKLKDGKYSTSSIDYGADVESVRGQDKAHWKHALVPCLVHYDKEKDRVSEVPYKADFEIRDEASLFYHGEYPYVDLTFFPEDDEFWSTGAVMPIEDLQMALNSTMNQWLTNANQQLNNMWVTSNTRIPDWEFISRPNGVIHADPADFKEVAHKDITGNALAMQTQMEQKIQRTTGITDQLAMGQASNGTDTATGMQLEQNNLDENLRLFMNMLEQGGIKKIAQHFLWNNAQFITSEQTIRIAGRHGYSHMDIKPDDVSASFDPIVIPNSTLPKNPVVRAQNLMNLKALADKEQKIQVNTAPIWKEIVAVMGMTDMDEIVPDDLDEAYEENELLKKGVPVECEPNDNHEKHIQVHQYCLISEQEKLDQKTVQRFVDHIKAHKTWRLAADPELLEKMAKGSQPTPGEINEQSQPPPPPMPMMPGLPGLPQQGGFPVPAPAITEEDLIAQTAGQLDAMPFGQGASLPFDPALELGMGGGY